MGATTKAIAAVVIFGVIQLTLLLYSVRHPSISSFVTASFLFGMVFYLAVWDYHSRKMRASGKESSS